MYYIFVVLFFSLGDFIVEITNNKTSVGLTEEMLKTEGFELSKDGEMCLVTLRLV